jgi:hypothetical protein
VLMIPRDQLLMYLEFINRAVRDPQIWERTIKPYHHYHSQISEMLEAGASEGMELAVQPDIASRVIIALAMGLLMQGFLDPQGADWNQVTSDGFNILINGLQVKK